MPVDLSGYTTVKERIDLFFKQYPDGRLVTDRVEMWLEVEPPRVVVKALAYRTPDDPLPAVGWSWMIVPGSSNFTRGSEIENTETSAWGRAIGALNIGIGNSIATTDEIAGKAEDGTARIPAPDKTDDGGLIGIVEKGTANDTDMEYRQTPDGWVFGFRLRGNGRGGIKVLAHDEVARSLAFIKSELVGQRVTCWGRISDEEYTPKGRTKPIVYQVLQLERIQTPDVIIPAPIAPGQVAAFDEPSDEEKAAILAAELAEATGPRA